jgi:BMFP domain-containing protein YqiC
MTVTREEFEALQARLLALELKLAAVSQAVTAPKHAITQGSGTGEEARG